jgi:hypothetical protein
MVSKLKVRPTGVIRTLPYFGAAVTGGEMRDSSKREAMRRAYRRMMRALRNLERNPEAYVYVAFPQKPTQEVLDCYLLVGGAIRVRARIGSWEPGDQIGTVNCWDDSARDAKWWAVLTAPVSFPDEPVKRRGFQGFRYTEELW